jgi:magnesium transporter
VGWYGMNFQNMPELHWKMGYPFVAILCGAVVLICIKIFKKHHWM